MYLRQSSWIEAGPRRRPAPVVLTPCGCEGLGAVTPYDQTCANMSAWNPFAWFYCFPYDVSTVVSGSLNPYTGNPIPAPAPPGVDLVSASEAAGNSAAVYAGNDAGGNPVYAVPQSPQDNVSQWRAQIQSYYGSLPADQSSGGCSVLGLSCTTVGIVAGVAIAAAVLFGGRRR